MSYENPSVDQYENRSMIPRPFTSRPEKIQRPLTSKTNISQGNTATIDTDYRPIRIRVFKNGDRFDPGTEIFVTRREFKHWLMLLDIITKKINSRQVVQRLFDFDGDEVTEFQELEDGGKYVAAGFERFKHEIPYGKYRSRTWQPPTKRPPHIDPTGVDSHESIEIYLKKMGFESQSGKVYPFDDPDKDPQTKAAVQAASLEKAIKRQRLKEERAATRLSRYHSDGSLPRIDQNNKMVQHVDDDSHTGSEPPNYSTERQKYNNYRNRYYDQPDQADYQRDQGMEWESSKYPPDYQRRRSYEYEYDQGYGSVERPYNRRYSPPDQDTNRGRQYREHADRATSKYGDRDLKSALRPKTSRAKSTHEVFERLARQRGSTAMRRKTEYEDSEKF